jgi:hypothetical protein
LPGFVLLNSDIGSWFGGQKQGGECQGGGHVTDDNRDETTAS